MTGRLRVPGVGSSPLTRGARASGKYNKDTARIIPAYAGSTKAAACCCAPLRDHPRLRGEHENVVVLNSGLEGSSPLTRGAHRDAVESRALHGIIPAYAGSTSV